MDYDDEAVAVTRDFTRLKHRLMPYLFRAARRAAEHGTPLMRAMVLEFPDDPACQSLDRPYMLGDDLLVAPVFSVDGEVEYYVPAGTWTHVLSGDQVQGPGWRRERYGFDSLPLLARPRVGDPVRRERRLGRLRLGGRCDAARPRTGRRHDDGHHDPGPGRLGGHRVPYPPGR
ncbi:hypothetical protein ACIHCM_10240 [Streptomyces sp. NPDC052023]|uniref:hypothetical protein n=1 Tax=Streptomyces sp. NPDC052023 TaxID=3365681 RepID=UPI0037CCD21E